MSVGKEYLRVVQDRFAVLKKQGEKAISQLEQDDLHWALNDATNSIAVIIQHVSGNMISRWTDFLTTDGEKDNRNRDGEFVNRSLSKEELMDCWDQGWNVFFHTLNDLDDQDLLKAVFIRGQAQTVLNAIETQMAHYASHIGQIMFIGKQIKGDQWISLSIPKGESAAYLEQMLKK